MNDSLSEGPKSLLLVDDDRPFLQRLARAMETRGFEVRMAQSVAEAMVEVRRDPPAYAVVDLRLERRQWPRCRRGHSQAAP
jgi:two-component system, response regulator RegA